MDFNDLISGLVDMLSPSEAEAAPRRSATPTANQIPTQATPTFNLPPVQGGPVMDLNGLNFQQAIQLRQQLAQETLRRQQLGQQQQKIDAKAHAASQDVGGRLAQILGGSANDAQAQEPDVIFRGVTPGTGTPYFSNYQAPEGYAPEADRQAFNTALEQRNQRIATRQAAPSGGLDPATLTKASELATVLEQAKVPSDVRTMILQRTFPGFKSEKDLTPEQTSKMWKYNPDTQDFDPVPPELTGKSGKELQAMGFRVISDKQRSAVDEMKDVQTAFQQLSSAVRGVQGKGALSLKASELTGGNFGGDEGALFKKARTNFTTIFDKFLGGVRGAASPQMQAIRDQVLPSIFSTGTLSDKLMSDLQELINTMSDSRLKSVVGSTAYNATQQNRAAQQVLNTWQAERGGTGKSVQPAAQAPAQGGWQIGPGGIRFRIK